MKSPKFLSLFNLITLVICHFLALICKKYFVTYVNAKYGNPQCKNVYQEPIFLVRFTNNCVSYNLIGI